MATKTIVSLLFTLFIISTLVSAQQDPELEQCKHQCKHQEQFDDEKRESCLAKCEDYYRGKHGAEAEEEEGGDQEEKNPYVLREEHFKRGFKTEEGWISVLQKFSERSEVLKGIDNFRVSFFEANPHTFMVPNHWDADGVIFVVRGQGSMTFVYEDRRESFNVKRGDIIHISAGTTVYLINKDDHEKLFMVELVRPISTPGHFEAFYGASGENPQSFFRAFSTEILEAVFNTRKERLEKVFGQQRQGEVVKATKQQIKELSQHEEGIWPFKYEPNEPFNLFEHRPIRCNNFGKLYEVTPQDSKHLRNLDVAVSFSNITKGSMHTLYYNSRATKVAFVTKGEGEFEMACPHMASKGSEGQKGGGGRSSQAEISYQKVRAHLRPGVGFVVPAGHPFVTIASPKENLEVICFEINADGNNRFTLAGKRNIFKQMQRAAKELSFNLPEREVDEVFGSQDEEFFMKAPQQQHESGRADE